MKFPRRRAKIPGKNQILGPFLAKLCKSVNSSSCREKFTSVLKQHDSCHLQPTQRCCWGQQTHDTGPGETPHWANTCILPLLLALRLVRSGLCELLLLLDRAGLELMASLSTDPPDAALSSHFYSCYCFQLSPSATLTGTDCQVNVNLTSE